MNLSKQEFLSTTSSAKHMQDKRKLREQLESDVAEFLKRGGEIKQAVSQIYKAKHGTSGQYIKLSCRCEICMKWALKKGVVKTDQLKERKV